MLLPNYTVAMLVGGLLRIANEQGRQHEPTLSQQNYEMYVQHVLENLEKFEEKKIVENDKISFCHISMIKKTSLENTDTNTIS